MPIRELNRTDMARCAEILAAAFRGAPIMGTYLHPYSEKYPDGIYVYFLRMIRLAYAQGPPDDRIIVAYDTDEAGIERNITGYAHWHRKRAVLLRRSLVNRLAITLTEAYNRVEALVWPNHAIEPTRAEKLKQAGHVIEHHWSGSRAESWYLDLLAVDPACGGKGYGRELVAWGFAQAKAEGVGCSVMAASAKTTFYRACGFNVEVGNIKNERGEANPLAHEDMPGGMIMFWDNISTT